MVILHAFNRKYRQIIDDLTEISEIGYGAILLPPPLYSDIRGDAWWQRYQPKDYRILSSYLGRKSELEAIIRLAHQNGIHLYADIVLNHMANEFRNDKFDFPGAGELKNYADNADFFEAEKLYGDLSEPLFSYGHFHHNGNIGDWGDPGEVQYHNLSDLPDLNESDYVLEKQRELFLELSKFGFDGFRIDAVKHITEKQIDNIADMPEMQDKYLFGEVLTVSDEDRDKYMMPFLRATHMAAYDFVLFQTMREAFGFGGSLGRLEDPENENSALPKYRALTFSVNHDLPLNDGFRGLMLTKQDEHLANAYILGRDGGVPLMYSDQNESAHFDEDRDRWSDLFKRPDIVGMIKFHNAVQGLKQFTLFVDDTVFVFNREHRGFVAINKGQEGREIEFWTFGLKNPGKYKDMIHGHELVLKSEEMFKLYIPPRTAQMWLTS